MVVKYWIKALDVLAGGVTRQKSIFTTGHKRVMATTIKRLGGVSPCLHQQVSTQLAVMHTHQCNMYCKCVLCSCDAGKWTANKCSNLYGYVCKRKTVSVVETPRELHYIGRCPEKWLYFGHKVYTAGLGLESQKSTIFRLEAWLKCMKDMTRLWFDSHGIELSDLSSLACLHILTHHTIEYYIVLSLCMFSAIFFKRV